MRVESHERSTGMGATRYTAVLVDGTWVAISDMPHARYHGRDCGVHSYSVEVPDDTPVAEFYRSNSGKESVTIESEGVHFNSFEDARRYGEALGRKITPPSWETRYRVQPDDDEAFEYSVSDLQDLILDLIAGASPEMIVRCFPLVFTSTESMKRTTDNRQ